MNSRVVRLGETCQGLENLPARRSIRRRGRVCEGMKDENGMEHGARSKGRKAESRALRMGL